MYDRQQPLGFFSIRLNNGLDFKQDNAETEVEEPSSAIGLKQGLLDERGTHISRTSSKSLENASRRSSIVSAATRTSSKGIPGSNEDSCVFEAMRQIFSEQLDPLVQDTRNAVHVCVTLPQIGDFSRQYHVRLQQRPDFGDLYDGMVTLSERHIGGKVEMFVRFPQGTSQYIPLKISEWYIGEKDQENVRATAF